MIVVIDYGMGNLHSVLKALEYVTNEKIIVSNQTKDLEIADKIVLPGVGSFGVAMKNLEKFNLVKALHQEVIINKKPFLGICLGMQVLAEESFEAGRHQGLGFIHGKIEKFNFDTQDFDTFNPLDRINFDKNKFKIPHVGWNNITVIKDNSLLSNLSNEENFYFVHSYHLNCADESTVIAKCNYGYDFVAAIKKENIFATQFHPEKSQQAGLKLLKNFVKWDGL